MYILNPYTFMHMSLFNILRRFNKTKKYIEYTNNKTMRDKRSVERFKYQHLFHSRCKLLLKFIQFYLKMFRIRTKLSAILKFQSQKNRLKIIRTKN